MSVEQSITDQINLATVEINRKGTYFIQFQPDDAFGRQLREPIPKAAEMYNTGTVVLKGLATLLGGYVALKKNNKYMLLSVSIVNTCVIGLVPTLTNLWGPLAKQVLDSTSSVLVGYSEGFIYNIVAHWLPQSEIPLCVGLLFAGEPISFLLVYTPSRLIGPKFGASCLYYYATAFHVAWNLTYFIFGAQDPRTCYFLSADEREHIFQKIGEKRRIGSKLPIPWKQILKTPIYYGILASEIAYSWNYSITNTAMDGMNGSQSELVRNVFAVGLMFVPIYILIIVKILELVVTRRELINSNDARKIANTIGLWGTGLFALMMGYCTSYGVVYSVFIAYRMTAAFIFVGYKVTAFNIAPNYASMVEAFASGVSDITISSKPYLIRLMVKEKLHHTSYKLLLYIVALMSYVANIIFIISGHIHMRKFDSIGAVDWKWFSPLPLITFVILYSVLLNFYLFSITGRKDSIVSYP